MKSAVVKIKTNADFFISQLFLLIKTLDYSCNIYISVTFIYEMGYRNY